MSRLVASFTAFTRRLSQAAVVVLGLLPLLVSTPVAAQPMPKSELPDIGAPWDTTLSRAQAYQFGRMIMRQLRDADQVLEDPELTQYVQSLGHKLSSRASDGEDKFEFFVVKDGAINAFALPGGFIGVNAGLIDATQTESELAGVLAHEVAHVTQDHIARRIHAQGQNGLVTGAALLAAVLLGAMAGVDGDAIAAAASVTQGVAAQQAINFTRSNEYEADRVGIGILADAGFDPQGMPNFFETLGKRSGIRGTQIPEFLRTHPLEANRVAESRNRAAEYDEVEPPEDTLDYDLAKVRVRALLADTRTEAVRYFEDHAPDGILEADIPTRYGYAISLLAADQPGRAEPFFRALVNQVGYVTAFHSGLAESLIAKGEVQDGLEVYEVALRLFPRNIPLTVRYSRALMNHGHADQAHTLMLDLLNNINYTAEQLRLIALAASEAGDEGDAHYYMSEFHVVNGDLYQAIDQLKLAQEAPDLKPVQRERFSARIEEIEKVLPRDRRGRIKPRPKDQ
ncbi:MAG: M48 family metalloprotease [Pseudomonadota bacterium]